MPFQEYVNAAAPWKFALQLQRLASVELFLFFHFWGSFYFYICFNIYTARVFWVNGFFIENSS